MLPSTRGLSGRASASSCGERKEDTMRCKWGAIFCVAVTCAAFAKDFDVRSFGAVGDGAVGDGAGA